MALGTGRCPLWTGITDPCSCHCHEQVRKPCPPAGKKSPGGSKESTLSSAGPQSSCGPLPFLGLADFTQPALPQTPAATAGCHGLEGVTTREPTAAFHHDGLSLISNLGQSAQCLPLRCYCVISL